MWVDTVTITGADDRTNLKELLALNEEYSFVEWGILFSQARAGTPRYPSLPWVRALAAESAGVALSAHVCGSYVRDMLRGGRAFLVNMPPETLKAFGRIQWNFHCEHFTAVNLATIRAALAWYLPRGFIFQCDGVNDILAESLSAIGARVCPLFDRSGGAGKVPEQWPTAPAKQFCGYAGGLGPETIDAELDRIAKVATGCRIWIDMERRVRTNEVLDLEKVRAVLERVKVYRERAGGGGDAAA